RPRTAVDLAVPFWPRMSTPPTRGSTALIRSAVLRDSCPTIAENGYVERSSRAMNPPDEKTARLHYMVDGPLLSPSDCGQDDRHWKVPQSAGVTSPTLGQVFEYTQSLQL